MTPYSETVSKKWHKILDKFNKSGLTPVEFSKNSTYILNTFYAWRKRINNSNFPDSKDNFKELKLLKIQIQSPIIDFINTNISNLIDSLILKELTNSNCRRTCYGKAPTEFYGKGNNHKVY